MKLVLNPTDETLAWRVSVRQPRIEGSMVMDTPAKLFIFEPGEIRMDVPPEAIDLLEEHLGPKGLMTVEHDGDIEAAKRQGRQNYFNWLGLQIRRFQNLNRTQRAKGLELLEPTAEMQTIFARYKRLKAREFNHLDQIMTESIDGPKDAMDELTGDYEQNRNHEREAGHQQIAEREGMDAA